MTRLRPLRSLLRRLRRRGRVAPTDTCVLGGEASNDPFFVELERWVKSGGLRGRQPDAARAWADELSTRLAGDVRTTSYRHEMTEMDAAEVCRLVSSVPAANNLLHMLVTLSGATRVIEMGSAFGVSTVAMANALSGSKGSTLDGIEFEDWRAKIANEGAQRQLGERGRVHAGRIEDIAPPLAAERGPFDMAFIDAMHTYEATLGYHELFAAHCSPGAVAVYDDCNWSEDMQRFQKRLIADPRIVASALINGRWAVVRYGGAA